MTGLRFLRDGVPTMVKWLQRRRPDVLAKAGGLCPCIQRVPRYFVGVGAHNVIGKIPAVLRPLRHGS